MKKLICAILAVVLCLSLTACAGKPAESKIEKGPYTDGTYEVNDAEYSHGWKEYVIITVTDGNIASVEFDGKNEAGEKKSGDAAYKESMTAYGGTTYPEKFYPEVAENFVAAGYDETAMENVAGATTSTETFKVLAAKAMEMIENGEPGVFNFSPYKDGEYTVEAAEYSHGYKDYVIVTVSGGEITAVEFDSKNEEGGKKSEDAAYKESMTAYGGTTYPEKFFPEIVENYMAAGSLETMESVAGATSSSNAFKELMAKALENAKEGKTGVDVLSAYKDGTYRAETPVDSHGWTEFVEVTVADGTITEIVFDAVNGEGGYKSKDAAYKESMTAYGGTTYPEKFYPEIVDNFINSGFVANDMEVVAGATTSSESFKKLIVAALESAAAGNTETVVLADEK